MKILNPDSSKHPLRIIVNLDSITHPLAGIGHFSLNLIEEFLNHPEVGSLFCNIGSKLKPCPNKIKLFNLIKAEAQKIFLASSEIAQGLKRLLLDKENNISLRRVGLETAKNYTWKIAIKRWVSVFKMIQNQ